MSLEPSLTIPCLTAQGTTSQGSVGRTNNSRFSEGPGSLTCQSPHMLLSPPWMLLLSPFAWSWPLEVFSASASHLPWYKSLGCSFNTLCMTLSLLPCHCLLRACWMFSVCRWGVMGLRMATIDLIALVLILRQCLTHRDAQWIFVERKEGLLASLFILENKVSWKKQRIFRGWFWSIAIDKDTHLLI